MEQWHKKIQTWISPWLWQRIPFVIIAGMIVGFLIVLVTAEGAVTATGRLGGDYPAFYSAGRIVVEGDWENLYSLERQAEEQESLLGVGRLLYFAYPPFVALPFGILAELEYRWSYLCYTVILFCAFLFSIHLLRSLSPFVNRHYWAVVSGSLLFYPLAKAIGGSQNTPITLLLLIGAWWGVTHGRPYLSGLLLGLLLYKPHFALPMIGLYLVAGYGRVVVGAAVAGLSLYGVSAWMLGPDWVFQWAELVSLFAVEDIKVNGHQAVSWVGFISALFGNARGAATAGIACSILTAIYLMWKWWCLKSADLDIKMALAVTGIILISPHTMFYDAAFILIAIVVLADRLGPDLEWRIPLLFLVGVGHYFSAVMGFSTVFFAVIASGYWVIRMIPASRDCEQV